MRSERLWTSPMCSDDDLSTKLYIVRASVEAVLSYLHYVGHNLKQKGTFDRLSCVYGDVCV